MAPNLYLVFSKPPADVTDDEYNGWYGGTHIHEILATPGFVAARRYAMSSQASAGLPAGFPYLALYETEGDTETLRRNLGAEVPNMKLPEWFSKIGFASWAATAVGGAEWSGAPDRLYMNYSHEPDHMSFDEYTEWYREHQEQNIATTEHLARGWRFHLEGEGRDGGAKEDGPSHLALYEIGGTLEGMSADLGRARQEGVVSLPDWFRRSASVAGEAIGERQVS